MKQPMVAYKLQIIKRHDFMAAVLNKANELGYRIRDPRESFETQWQKNDYMALTETGHIDFYNKFHDSYEMHDGVEIDIDWFNVEKPVKMVTLTMPLTELNEIIRNGPVLNSWNPEKWSIHP